MNIQTEKLQLIEWLIKLQDNSILNKIKELKQYTDSYEYEASLKPMSKDELVRRAKESEEAIRNNQVSDIDSIINEDWD